MTVLTESCYLRVEGVNLTGIIDDADDLSTSRGGSFLLLKGPERVRENLASKGWVVDVIMESASIGLYKISGLGTPGDAERSAREALADGLLRHATFVVDTVPNGDFADVRASLMNKNRWRQMQAATLVYPELQANSFKVCELTGVHPAVLPDDRRAPEGKRQQGRSPGERRTEGRDQKQKFYENECGFEGGPGWGYALDLEDIASDSRKWNRLENKIAIFYADGNNFGTRQARFDEDEQQRFSTTLRQVQRQFFADLLSSEILHDEGWQVIQDHTVRIRLEVLISGGDDLMLILPAWRGWAFAEYFFSHIDALLQTAEFAPLGALTWSAGLVFAHHKAPVRPLKQRVRELAETVKASHLQRQEHGLLYHVFESFDDAGVPMNDCYFQARYPFLLPKKQTEPLRNDLVLTKGQVTQIAESARQLRRILPRRPLYRAVQSLMRRGADTLDWGDEEAVRHFAQFREAFSSEPAALVHLAELWDYADPEDSHS